jgi:hypothetical protein
MSRLIEKIPLEDVHQLESCTLSRCVHIAFELRDRSCYCPPTGLEMARGSGRIYLAHGLAAAQIGNELCEVRIPQSKRLLTSA